MSELENLPLKEDKIKLGFETETVTLRLDQIIPLKVIAPNIREKAKYKQIFASIKEVGIIEPPPINESISGVNPDKIWIIYRRHINGKEALYG